MQSPHTCEEAGRKPNLTVPSDRIQIAEFLLALGKYKHCLRRVYSQIDVAEPRKESELHHQQRLPAYLSVLEAYQATRSANHIGHTAVRGACMETLRIGITSK